MVGIRTNSTPPSRVNRDWLRFPANRLINDPRLEGVAGKTIWLVIPLEYYVLTRFDGGMNLYSFLPAAVMALICVISIIVASACIAIVYPPSCEYSTRVWGLTIANLSIWAGMLALLALSYFTTSLLLGFPEDLVGTLVCNKRCFRYPAVTWQTFLSYLIYAGLAALILSLLVRERPPEDPRNDRISKQSSTTESPSDRVAEPNILLAAIVVAVLVMLLHRVSTLSSGTLT
jgi:hypothetical protein